jgi:hypothetical protein
MKRTPKHQDLQCFWPKLAAAIVRNMNASPFYPNINLRE